MGSYEPLPTWSGTFFHADGTPIRWERQDERATFRDYVNTETGEVFTIYSYGG